MASDATSTPTTLIRTRSPIIRSFPWASGSVISLPDIRTLAASDHWSSGFLKHLQSFELNILLCPHSAAGKCFRHLLRLDFSNGPNPELRVKEGSKGSPQEWSDLFSIVAAYKLADVLVTMENQDATPYRRVDKAPKMGPARSLPALAKLGNWPKVLLNFKKVVGSEAIPLRSDVKDVQVKLLKRVAQFSENGDANNMMSNILAASLHLSYLLTQQFAAHEVPELTEVLEDLTMDRLGPEEPTHQTLNASRLTESEIEFWRNTLANEDMRSGTRRSSGRERQPLHLALGISPLYLLIPVQLLRKQVGRENLFQTAKALGNQKPQCLKLVEKCIWRLLFALANGNLEPEVALKTLVGWIPWEALTSCSADDSSWFKIEQPQTNDDVFLPLTDISVGHLSAFELPVQPSTLAVPPFNDSPQHQPSFISPEQGHGRDLFDIRASVSSAIAYSPGIRPPTPKTANPPIVFHSLSQSLGNVPGEHPPSPSCCSPTAGTSSEMDIGTYDEESEKSVGTSSSSSCSSPSRRAPRLDDNMRIDQDETLAKPPRSESTRESDEQSTPDPEHMQIDEVKSERGAMNEKFQGNLGGEDEIIDGDVGGENEVIEEEVEEETEGGRDSKKGCNLPIPNSAAGLANARPSERVLRGRRVPNSMLTLAPLQGKCGHSNQKRKREGSDVGRGIVEEKKEPTWCKPGPGSKDEPIDVDEYRLLTAKVFLPLERILPTLKPLLPLPQARFTTRSPMNIWDGKSLCHEIWPYIHDKQELIKFAQILSTVEKTFVDGKPLHVAMPDRSLFHILSFQAYSQITHEAMEVLLQTKCVVVTDMPWKPIRFDRNGLRSLAPLDAVVSIQDLSQPHPEGDLTQRVVQGTLAQMLESAKQPGRGPQRRKALNGLSFPFNVADSEDAPFAACRVAWSDTSGTACPRDARMPVSDVHFGLGATEGALTFWHIDSDGLATVIDVKAGSKVWIVGSGGMSKFSTLGSLLSEGFDLDIPPQNFDTEAILLTANTRLIMRPNVLHAAYTSEDAICHGSHFYSTGAMQSTLVSLIHGFICHSYITNISHPESRVLLRRIVHFYHRGLIQQIMLTDSELGHLPKLSVSEGSRVSTNEALNFLAACILAFFANVLDPRTYLPPGTRERDQMTEAQRHVMETCDANAIPSEERDEICEARGASLDAFGWFRNCFDVCKEGSSELVDLVSLYVVQLARSILRYKYAASANAITSAGACQVEDMERQLENVLKLDSQSWKIWTSQHQGKWLDKQMRVKANVETHSGGISRGSRSISYSNSASKIQADEQDRSRHEALYVDIPEFEWKPQNDRRKMPWRSEGLLLENAHLYQITRNGARYSRLSSKWVNDGATGFDLQWRSVVSWRALQEARIVRRRVEEGQQK